MRSSRLISWVTYGVAMALIVVPLLAVGAETKPEEPKAPEESKTDANPEACNDLLGLPKGTIRMDADKKIMNSEVCDAYLFLISRYSPGPRSSVGLSNPRVEGIVKLNPDFAVALAKMLKAAPPMGINSAYRTPAGQGAKNPQSNHVYGCAVDLGYSQNSCGQAQCQWVLQNAPSFGLHIRMKYGPEWNHVEPVAKDACRNNGPGVGTPVAASPSSGVANYARELFGLGGQPPPGFAGTQGQNCTLPDGAVVPCSAIANPGGGQPQQGVQSGGQSGGSRGGSTQGGSQQVIPIDNNSGQESGYSADLSGGKTNTPITKTKSLTETILESISRNTTISSTTSSSTKGVVATSTQKLSPFDQISIFARGTTTPGVNLGTTTIPLVLVVDETSAVGIQNQEPTQVSIVPVDLGTPGIIPTAQETFSSPELGGETSYTAHSPSQPTFGPYQKILTDMQSIALNMLAYLRPFGRPTEPDTTYQHADWSE